MTNRYKQFDINGNYSLNHFCREFEGKCRTFPNGKLIGLISEEGKNIFETAENNKIIIGLTNQNNRMNFWKISENKMLPASVSTLEEVQDFEYKGVWSPFGISTTSLIQGFGCFPRLTQVGEAFDLEGIEAKLDVLSDIPKKAIQDYLNPNIINDVLNFSQNSIYLDLTKK
jgi:hypothetical protein